MNTPYLKEQIMLPTGAKALGFGLLLICGVVMSESASAAQSIARVWDERALASIRVDTPHPPAQARNLFSLSTCMYDAWAAYDTNSVGFIYHVKHSAVDVEAARREAISYAAWRLLKERHVFSKTSTNTLAADDALMASLGYDTNNTSRDLSTPAGVGNSVYDAVSLWFSNDGSRQTNGTPATPYPDLPAGQGAYAYVNPALAAGVPGITVTDVNHWQRLQIVNGVDQNGFPTGPIQNYLGAQWLGVRPCALSRIDPTVPWIDPGPPPFLNGVGDAQFREEVVACIRASSQLSPEDGVTMDISPGALGNNGLFADDGHGHALNPVTGQPYAPNVVKRGDFQRVLAEFWADGPNSETPPGHWNVLANEVADHPLTVKKIGGVGSVVSDLEWDVKVYFALNAATHDAACAAWSLKRYYNGWRPISAVRFMGQNGQSSDPNQPSYHTNGLPLIPNLIELVTAQTALPGGRHADLEPGTVAIFAWTGQPSDPTNQIGGVKWIQADSWMPYQKKTFVSPAFPGYVSGHSSFSRAAAEVMTAITGSPFFPGGMGTHNAIANTTLSFEKGPSQSMQLQWATYYDAGDFAGASRIFGGIHPPVDNFAGRQVGAQVGKGVWEASRKYFDGSIAHSPTMLALNKRGDQTEVRYETLRGFYYKLQSTPNLSQPFTDEPGDFALALDSSAASAQSLTNQTKFFRAVRRLSP